VDAARGPWPLYLFVGIEHSFSRFLRPEFNFPKTSSDSHFGFPICNIGWEVLIDGHESKQVKTKTITLASKD
jgi:hypothetical protein